MRDKILGLLRRYPAGLTWAEVFVRLGGYEANLLPSDVFRELQALQADGVTVAGHTPMEREQYWRLADGGLLEGRDYLTRRGELCRYVGRGENAAHPYRFAFSDGTRERDEQFIARIELVDEDGGDE